MVGVECDEPAVGDRDAMGVAAEIGQDLCGSAEGPLGVNNPVDALAGFEAASESVEFGKRSKVAEEAQGAGVEGRDQAFEKKPAKEPGQRFDGQEEVRSAGDPARAIGREAATRNDAMDVGMMHQRLSPGVEDGDAADRTAEPAWVGAARDAPRAG